jgi:hypothetical protein
VLLLPWIWEGAKGTKLMVITGVSVTVVDTDLTGRLVVDAVDVAVIVMVSAGAVTGAVKSTAEPLAV